MQTENKTNKVPGCRWLPVKIWLLAVVVLGPLFFWLVSYQMESPLVTNPTNFGIFLVLIFFGVGISLPTLLIALLINAFLLKPYSYRIRLLSICALGIAGCLISFAILDIELSETIVCTYSFAILVSSAIFYRR
jgi:hypothetical protein